MLHLVWDKKLFQRMMKRIAKQWTVSIDEKKEADTFLAGVHFNNLFTC